MPFHVHVRLDHGIGAVSVQRAGLEYRGEGLTLGVWPGELKAQAQYLYSEGRAQRLLTLESAEGWQVEPSPHLAFFTAPPAQRAYLTCRLSLADYVSRWAGPDHAHIGAYIARGCQRRAMAMVGLPRLRLRTGWVEA